MDSKVLLVCLSGLCLGCSAAPFDPLATASNWVGTLGAGTGVVAAGAIPVVKAAIVGSPMPLLAPEPLNAPNPPMPTPDVPFVGGQFHAQDELGQYAFGHYGGPNTRVESKDAIGRVTGSFAYIDGEGDVQVRKYASAPGMGTKVAGSDIPVDPNH